MQTRELVTRLYERHGDGLLEKLTAIRYHNVTSRARHGLAGGSTGTRIAVFSIFSSKPSPAAHLRDRHLCWDLRRRHDDGWRSRYDVRPQ